MSFLHHHHTHHVSHPLSLQISSMVTIPDVPPNSSTTIASVYFISLNLVVSHQSSLFQVQKPDESMIANENYPFVQVWEVNPLCIIYLLYYLWNQNIWYSGICILYNAVL